MDTTTKTTKDERALAIAKRLRSRIKASADGWHFAGSDAAVDFHRTRIRNANWRLAGFHHAGLITREQMFVICDALGGR